MTSNNYTELLRKRLQEREKELECGRGEKKSRMIKSNETTTLTTYCNHPQFHTIGHSEFPLEILANKGRNNTKYRGLR